MLTVLGGVERELSDDVPAAIAAAARQLARIIDDAETAARDATTAARELRLTMETAREFGRAGDDTVDEIAAQRAKRRERAAGQAAR